MTRALELVSYIGLLRRNFFRNHMVMAVCEELEKRLVAEASYDSTERSFDEASLLRPDEIEGSSFDRRAVYREYMRQKRGG
jgi:hypothetical protein